MRCTLLFIIALFVPGCSKSDGEICIDNYMEMYDRANPDATNKQRNGFERVITIRCTDPHS